MVSKRRQALGLLRDIDRVIEKQFYDEFGLLENVIQREGPLAKIEEVEETGHEDLEMQEQKWFNTQMEWTRRVSERKGATHRYIKDARPTSSKGEKGKNVPVTATGVNRQRKKLEEAIKFNNRK